MLDWGPGLALAREEMRGRMMGGLMVMMLPPLEMSQRVSVVLVRKLERGPRGRKKTPRLLFTGGRWLLLSLMLAKYSMVACRSSRCRLARKYFIWIG